MGMLKMAKGLWGLGVRGKSLWGPSGRGERPQRSKGQETEHRMSRGWGESWETQGRHTSACAMPPMACPTPEASHAPLNYPHIHVMIISGRAEGGCH